MPAAARSAARRPSSRRPLTPPGRVTPLALWRRAQGADRLYVAWFVALGALIAAARPAGWPVLLLLHALAIAAIAALVAAAPRWPAIHAWYPIVLPLATFPEVARLNLMVAARWQDAALIAFEHGLFAEPPTAWLPQVTPVALAELFRLGYLSYFVLLPIVAARFRLRRQEAPFRGVIAASVLAYLLCYLVFLAWPTEGPAHTLRHLAAAPANGGPLRDLVLLVQRAGVHGNAFPSAHVAGALPPVIFAWRYAPRLALALAPLIPLMGLGAVHDGYHYASDVVAGAIVGAAAAGLVLAVQQAPAWARRVNLPAASAAATDGRGA